MPWYQDFFGEDYMRFHLLGGEREDQRAPMECDFVVNALALQPGARVLDLCCGQGRHSVELSQRGYRVTGIDLSDYLLGHARDRAAAAGVEAEFVRGDMRDLPWTDEFDAAVNMFTSFGYLENDEENERVLHAVRRALRPGGRFLLDLPTRERMAVWHDPRDWYEHEDCIVLDTNDWDAARGLWRHERVIVEPDGARRRYDFTVRVYCHPEIVAMLTRAGLEWQQTCSDYEQSDYGADSRRMLIITHKPPGGEDGTPPPSPK